MTSEGPSPLLLFLKAPRPGRVKSRLAVSLGEANALILYRAFVEDLLETIDGTRMPCRIFVHPPDAIPAVAAWLGERSYLPQEGADLGERMLNAFRAIFAEGCSRAVLIGSDLPDLPAGLLLDAFAGLDRSDAVIGPAQDGGYYLVGFRRESFDPEIFQGTSWGGPDVFDRTMTHFRKSRSSVHILPPWRDMDTAEDLRDLVTRGRTTAFAARRTMQAAEAAGAERNTMEGSHA